MQTDSARITPIVLAGGSGTRLWPMSRSSRPKQFLNLVDDHSLFQDTLLRLAGDSRYGEPVVVTNEDYRFLVAEQAQELGLRLAGIILEPVARNTAPAIVAAALFASREQTDRVLHILPSDHKIVVDAAYTAALDAAETAARDGMLVTFGIAPTEPATGFGYIEAGARDGSGTHKVARFVEKPDEANARAMIDAGNYFWNSGMFVFASDVFLAECGALAPEIVAAVEPAVARAVVDLDFLRLEAESFAKAPNSSID
jgi:mannose-1-phosphate guanylyltransferase